MSRPQRHSLSCGPIKKTKLSRGSLRATLAFLAAAALSVPVEGTILVREPGGLTAETAALILSGQQGGDLAMEVLAVPLAWANDAATVGLFVEVAGRDLVRGHQEEELRVEFLVYAIAGEASVRGYVMQAFELDLGQYGEALASGGLKFNGQLELPPGDYSLAVMVRSPREGAPGLGLRRVAVSLSAPDARGVLPQPRFSAPADAWINVFQVATGPREGGLSRDRLRRAARRSAAKPILVAGSRAEIVLPAVGPLASSQQLSIELVDGRGEVVGEKVASLETPGEAPESAFVIRSFEVIGFRAGEYLLRVKAPGEAGAPIYSPSLPVIVAQGGAAETWAATEPETAAAPVETGELPRRRRRQKVRAKDVEALKQRYAEILRLSTGEDRASAFRALRRFEQEAVAEFGERGLPSLVAAEMQLIKVLGKTSLEALIPVARLHHQAYREHRSRREFLLATHSRNLALAVVELYVGSEDRDKQGVLALRAQEQRNLVGSRLLASFGGDLQRSGLRRFSERLFLRALELDHSNPAALLGLGASFEKYSEYAEAVDYLERLVAAQPENGEGRLRLGINLRRLGRKAKARKQLEEIIGGDYDGWTQSLAYQELAQMDLVAGHTKESADLLNRALERFPNEPKFYLQLAYLRNAAGEPWRAQAELDRLSRVRGPDSVESPRYRYSNWPATALERTWARTGEDVESRLEALASAIAEGAEGAAL